MNIMKNRQIKGVILTLGMTLLLLILAIYIWSMDGLHHGYYSERPSDIVSAMQTQGLSFENKVINYTVTAKTKHLKALEIYIESIPEDITDTDEIEIMLSNNQGTVIARKSCLISDLTPESWNKIYISETLTKGESYTFTLTDKTGKVDDKILLTYGYSESTLTVFGKLLVIMIIILAWSFIFVTFWIRNPMKKIVLQYILLPLALVILLSWSYFSNPFDINNTSYNSFQQDSDSLVLGRIIAKEKNVSVGEYGLGRIHDIKSIINTLNVDRSSINPITSEEEGYVNGYSQNTPCVVWQDNNYTRKYLVAGNSVLFETGKQYLISSAKAGDLGWYVTFDTTDTLSEETCGSVFECKILDQNNEEVPSYIFVSYKSQYGLQGRVMAKISKLFKYENRIKWMSLFCCIAMAIVVLACVILLQRKYNKILAGCFLIVFWLSPWVVNFAKSVYWVEFTWLLPFMAGLIIANWIDNKYVRRCGYFMVFFFVFVKCLCGYEYITFVMLGTVWILGVDFIIALWTKDKQKAFKVLRVLIMVGFAALVGFVAAILIHAKLRGDGDIFAGLKSIYENDLLRRTLGGDIDDFSSKYTDSLNASILDVLIKYFNFSTQVITGIDANLFPIIAITPLFINGWNIYKKNVCFQDILLYVTAFVISISWFVLGKSHSYVHTHMNYVCWYYWFVPICFYIIVKQIINSIKGKGLDKQRENS